MSTDQPKVTGRSITTNAFWRLAERICAQGVNFIVSVVLARILSPDEYGLCSLTMIFTTILGVFITSGLGTALIQRKDIDDLDCSTALWANIGIDIILYHKGRFTMSRSNSKYNDTAVNNRIGHISLFKHLLTYVKTGRSNLHGNNNAPLNMKKRGTHGVVK